MTTPNFCLQCGTQARPEALYCANCGRLFDAEGADDTRHDATDRDRAIPTDMPYRIPLERVLLMTVLSFGLYIFYWYYITWKHYRDHTGEDAYPVWHALTMLVPAYSLFRTHAHMRVYRQLMTDAGLASTISLNWAVVAVLVTDVLGWLLYWLFISGDATASNAMLSLVISIGSMVIVAWLLVHVQGNLNSYWNNLTDERVANAKIGIGEIIFAAIGILSWLDSIAALLSESYRAGG